jgi:CHAT domain-containing protein
MFSRITLLILLTVSLTLKLVAQDLVSKIIKLDSICEYQMEAGDYSGLNVNAENMLKLAKESKIDSLLKKALNKSVAAAFYNNRKEEAIELAEENIKLIKRIQGNNNKDYIGAINDLAYLNKNNQNFDKAEKLYFEALNLQKQLDKKAGEYAVIVNNLASLYVKTEKYEEAEPLFIESLKLRKEVFGKNSPKYAHILKNLAALYEGLEQYDLSESMHKEAIDIYIEALGENNMHTATALNDLGSLYSAILKHKEAAEIHLRALNIRKNVLGEDQYDYAASLQNLSNEYMALGMLDSAMVLTQKSIRIKEKITGKGAKYAISMNAMGNILNISEKFDSAYFYLFESLLANTDNEGKNQLFRQPDSIHLVEYTDNSVAAQSIISISKSLALDLPRQLSFCKAAIKYFNRLKNSFDTDFNKVRIIIKNKNLMDNGINAAYSLGPTHFEDAFMFSEQNKSTLLSDATKTQKARESGLIPENLAKLESSNLEKRSKLKKEILLAEGDKKVKLMTELTLVNFSIDSIKKLTKKDYPEYYKERYSESNITSTDIQKIIDKDAVFLEYFIANNNIFLFCIASGDKKLYKLEVNQKELTNSIKEFRKSLSDFEYIKTNPREAYELYTKSAYSLYKNLVLPFEKEFSAKKLIIITDGELGHIPFEALLSEEVKSKIDYKLLPYLNNKYTIIYNFSGLIMLEQSMATPKKNNGKILGIAASYDERLNYKNLEELKGPYISKLRKSLNPLPSAKIEVNTLSSLYSGMFLLNKEASEHNFKKNAQDFGIIHLAMHGILNTRYPSLSSLAFTENEDSTEDNFLQAAEISHMKLNASLAILSACETGYGKFMQGEGIISLARSFMYAGVPSLTVSLWQVNDASTAEIMKLFYNFLSQGLSKSEALQKAKIKYIKDVKNSFAAHPAFWAAFVIIGDDSPVYLKGKWADFYLYGSIIGLLLAGSLSILIFRKKRKKVA